MRLRQFPAPMELGTVQGSALAAVPVEHLGVELEGCPQATLQGEAGAEPVVILLMNLFPLEPVALRRQTATLDPKHDAQGAAEGVDLETADRSGGRSRGRSTTAGKANCQPKTATVRVPQKGPLNVKTPRLAKRNLRDKGQLPRRRGPDKINLDKSNSSIDSDSLPEISDEFAPEAITLPQLDGFLSDISTSDGAPSTIDDEINNSTIHYAQSNPMDEIEVPNSSEFRPNLASTQNGEENQDGSTPPNINMPHLDAWLRGIRNAPPIDGSTPPDPDRQHSQSSNSPDHPATGSGEAGHPVPTPLG